LHVGHGPGQHPTERVRAHIRADPGIGGHQPPAFPDARHLGEQRAADECQRGPADVAGRGGAPLPGERPVDRATQEDRRQDDGGIHDDAGDGSQHELAGDLPEVRPHLPEKPEHAGALWEGRGRHVPNAGSSRSPVTRATITSRARLKSSLTAGTSSQRSIRRASTANSPRSQAKVTTAAVPATSAGVGRCGRRPSTSMPSARSPWMTRSRITSSGSISADVAHAPRPRAAARRLKYSTTIKLLTEPYKQTNRTFPYWMTIISSTLFTHA